MDRQVNNDGKCHYPKEVSVPSPNPTDPRPGGSGGFESHAGDVSTRPRLSRTDMLSFLPSLGPFQFPAPYNTTGIRLTNEYFGQIEPVGYSYWNNINNHAGLDSFYAFIGRTDASPILLSVNKITLEVRKIMDLPYWGTGEGWYWSKSEPTLLYAFTGQRLLRYDVVSQREEIACDLTEYGLGDHFIWQPHSNYDDTVHSFTLRDSGYIDVASVVCFEAHHSLNRRDKRSGYDECQIDKSGRWVVIKEGSDDNVIKNTQDPFVEYLILNTNGAVAHSDMGFDYILGEDDHAPQPGAVRLWKFPPFSSPSPVVYHMTDWTKMSRHVSHCNAQPGDPENQKAFISCASRSTLPRSNEIVQFSLDGSLSCRVLAPNLTDLDASGGGEDYRKLPKGNIDPLGEYFIWTGNAGTDRLDLFAVRVPQ